MAKPIKSQRKNCAKPTLYKTPRGDFMADMGDGRVVPVVKTDINEYAEGKDNA